jgi:hypothetical protein
MVRAAVGKAATLIARRHASFAYDAIVSR